MKNSVLNHMVSVFKNAKTAVPVTSMTVFDWLRVTKYDGHVKILRSVVKSDPVRADELKKSLPAVTVSGLFSYRSKSGLQEHSGLICLDLDGKDNPGFTVEDLKTACTLSPWVAYAGLSASGNGVFAISPLLHPDKHLEHFRSMQGHFSRLGIAMDPSCSDISRLRFYSYDPAPYYNHQAEPYDGLDATEQKNIELPKLTGANDTRGTVERLVREICRLRLDITGGNKDWFNLAASISSEFGDSGRDFFHAISQFYGNDRYHYSPDETDKMYSRGLRYASRFSIRTFFSRCKIYGIWAKELQR